MTEPTITFPIRALRSKFRYAIIEHCIIGLDWQDCTWSKWGPTPIAECQCGYTTPIDQFYKHQAEAAVKNLLRNFWRNP